MLLSIDGLRVRRSGNEVVHHVDLHLDRGEIYGLLGPNGAGKSTTIAVILGLLGRAGGTVEVFGSDPARAGPAIRARLGVLPEGLGFYDWMTADAYLAFFAELNRHTLEPGERQRLLGQVGLGGQGRQRVGRFSRGMRQRLGLARALIGAPELLILDEPTGGLDPRGRRELHDLLRELAWSRRIAVLMSTHLLDDVDRLCHRAGLIVEGRTVVEGSLDELLHHAVGASRFRLRLRHSLPDHQDLPEGVGIVEQDGAWVGVEVTSRQAPEAVWGELLARGWPIVEIRAEEAGLETLYLSLTERQAA